MLNRLIFVALFGISLNADVYEKVKNILGESDYNTNENLIKYTFNNEASFYDKDNQINYALLTQKLQDNNLLKLDLGSTQDINTTFIINENPKNAIKILKETLKIMGYYQYFTQEAINSGNSFRWSVKLRNKSAINPLQLSNKLQLKNCKIVDIKREGNNIWEYSINKN